MATTTTAAPHEEVIENKPGALDPPLAAVAHDKPSAPPPQDHALPLANVPEPATKKGAKGSLDRDVALAKLQDDKRLSFVKAWEESEKSKVENKAQKKLSEVAAWENSKKAALEAQLRKIEEQFEKKKADYAEKIRNKVALVHKQAEEKKAMVEARRGEDLLKAEEMSVKYRATGHAPKKGCGCIGS